MALRNRPQQSPDVILLDIKMPEMDGYQVCSTLKADEETQHSHYFPQCVNEVFDKVKAFQVGGVDYITKPFPSTRTPRPHSNSPHLQQQKYELRQQIEKHQQTAEILYQSRSLLASLLNSSRDGIAAMQAVRDFITGEIEDFRYLLVNPIFANSWGKNEKTSPVSQGKRNC
jgi:PleD family two-component response regulator